MRRILLQWVLPAAITVGLLALAFSLIEDPAAIPGHIAGVPWHIHVLFILVSVLSMWFRAVRWAALIPGRTLTGRRCFSPLMIGFMLNSIFPARAGEFGRALVLGRREGLPFSAVLGSVVIERIFDGVILLASFALVLSLLSASLPDEVVFGDWTIRGDGMRAAVQFSAVSVIIVLAGVIAMLIPGPRRLLESVARRTLPHRWSEPAIDQLEKLIRGFHVLRSPRAIVVIILWTLVIWALVALTGLIAAWGFPALSAMTYLESWAIVVFVCVAILLPASPGYWGLYEVGVIAACITLGLTDDAGVAMGYSVVMHFWQIMINLVIGLGFAWAEGLRLTQLRGSEAPNDPV